MIAMRKPGLVSCVSGATAVEFAMILPALLMLLVGIISASTVAYSEASLHYAAEGAARSYSVSSVIPGQCGSAATAQSNAKTLYHGTGSPTFTASNPACGCQVNGTLNVVLNAGMAQWTIPLSATACFPANIWSS
jgi:Flp pilus assembly protein TadG